MAEEYPTVLLNPLVSARRGKQDTGTTHLLVRYEVTPGDADMYVAICGYKSGIKKDFSVDGARTTCTKCLEIIRWPK
jgi:hypothetical protein